MYAHRFHFFVGPRTWQIKRDNMVAALGEMTYAGRTNSA
jgi:hypothetical protein